MSGLNYFANFDDSEFKKYENTDSTRLNSDTCYIDRKNCDNASKLKFVTTNFKDLIEAKEKLNFYGMNIKDQLFVPSESIDSDSFLRYGETGGIITNCNIRNEYGQLPFPTVPYKGQLSRGDTDQEDKLQKTKSPENRNSCNPRESSFHNRSFYIFNDKIEIPDATKSVESVLNGFDLGRNGTPTRFMSIKSRTNLK